MISAECDDTRTGILLLGTLLLGAAVLWGCDTTVDLADEPSRAFTLWGSLTPQRDTQSVKVFPMGTRLEPVPGEALEARLTSEHLESGRTRTWRDSVVIEDDGDLAHVFWAPFTAEYGASYHLEVFSARQGTARTTVTVPSRVEAEAVPVQRVEGALRAGIRIPEEATEVIPEADLRYRVQIDTPRLGRNPPLAARDLTRIIELPTPVERESGGWRVPILLEEDAVRVDDRVAVLREELGLGEPGGPCCRLDLQRLQAGVRIVNAVWTFPGDSIDVSVVAQPDVRSNVENGFGLVGAGYTEWVDVPVGDSIAAEAGFRGDF